MLCYIKRAEKFFAIYLADVIGHVYNRSIKKTDRQGQRHTAYECMQKKDRNMLENSNLVEGKDAKELDRLIAEYQDITAKLADLDTSKKQVLTRIFELAQVGTNETGKFVFNVCENAGRESLSLKSLKEQAPELFKRISGMGLVSIGNSYLTVRGIKLKGDRA